MPTIPINQIVNILPGVIAGGGAASKLSGLVVTQDTSIPPGQQKSFFAAADVSSWFGPGAPETAMANAYFPGVVNGGQLPFVLKFARNAGAATPGGVFGAQLGALTLSQLQAFSGTLIVTTDVLRTSATINLAAASSFANAATLMTAGFTTPNFSITYDATRNRFLLLTTATGIAAVCSAVTGTLATNVGLSAAAGAFNQAAGTAIDTPTSAMNRAITQDMDWGTFTTSYAATISDRLLYAAWNSGQNYQFLYIGWDTDPASIVTSNAASFGAQVLAIPYQGTLPTYGDFVTAAAYQGYAASINFNVPNGRANLAFRQFVSGPPATASDLATANALLSNGYTYIGAYANAANTYTIAYNGKTSGQFLWVDTYLDQIYLNRELQRAFFEAMLASNSIPYNQDGYTYLYRAGADIAQAALTSGIIRAGVALSASQQAQVDTQAGRSGVGAVVATRGWYLLIGDPANAAQARQNRTSPTAFFWYADGGSIQQLTLRSVAVI